MGYMSQEESNKYWPKNNRHDHWEKVIKLPTQKMEKTPTLTAVLAKTVPLRKTSFLCAILNLSIRAQAEGEKKAYVTVIFPVFLSASQSD